jgi:hypothetical protein
MLAEIGAQVDATMAHGTISMSLEQWWQYGVQLRVQSTPAALHGLGHLKRDRDHGRRGKCREESRRKRERWESISREAGDTGGNHSSNDGADEGLKKQTSNMMCKNQVNQCQSSCSGSSNACKNQNIH